MDEDIKETEEQEKDVQKKIEVVTGDGNLDISPVHSHLEVEKPKPKEDRTIFIPEVKKEANCEKD